MHVETILYGQQIKNSYLCLKSVNILYTGITYQICSTNAILDAKLHSKMHCQPFLFNLRDVGDKHKSVSLVQSQSAVYFS